LKDWQMPSWVIPEVAVVSAEVSGTDARFPVHRIYCVGRNYADHAREMGMSEQDIAKQREGTPTFFMKPASALAQNGARVCYPSATNSLHFEAELVVALQSGGRDIPIESALSHVYGYAAGNDLTRRDLQAACKKAGLPWDIAKVFEQAAVLGAILPMPGLAPPSGAISLWVNDLRKQNAELSDMVWQVAEIISLLSGFFTLRAGDLIYTGTPAGVDALVVRDQVKITVAGLPELRHSIVAAD
jgi:fumarylpyruvate hydrolase